MKSTWHISGFVKAAESLEKRRAGFYSRGLKALAAIPTTSVIWWTQ
jgi:hypothetical protein